MRILLFTPITVQVEAAKRLGHHVTSVWHRYQEKNFFDPIIADVRRLSDEFIEGDLYQESEWLDRLAELFERHPDTVFIPGVPDDFLSPFLKFAERIGRLPNPRTAYEPFRDKSALRRLLASDPELSVFHLHIKRFADLRETLAHLEGVHILKPATSTGSKDIFRIDTPESAAIALARWENAPEPLNLVLEEYLDGTQFSVETVSYEGVHHILGITEKFPVEAPHYVENGGIFPAQISLDDEREIRGTIVKFLDLAGFRNGPTHIEVIRTPNGVKIVESNVRLGGLIPFLIEGAHGVNTNEFLTELFTGAVSEYHPAKHDVSVLGILNFGSGRSPREIVGMEDVRALPYLVKMNIWAPMKKLLRAPTNNEERHGYAVVYGQSLSSALARLAHIKTALQPRF